MTSFALTRPLRAPGDRNRASTGSPRSASVALAVFCLLATACSSGGGAQLGSGGKAPATTAPKFFPLTGLTVVDTSAATRSAITVKIENSPASRPQAGLDKADVVFEVVVEGGQTRFLAVFQSTDTDNAGPVRSVRPSDPAIVGPFGGIVAYSGGIDRFVNAMKATGLKNFDENNAGDAFRRRRDKVAPHNLYTSTPALYVAAGGGGSPPPKFADFLKPGEAFAPPGAVPVTHLTLGIGSSTTVDYDWSASAGTWLRSTDGRAHTAEGGGQLAPNTIIVQYVNYQPTGEVDTTGAVVSEANLVGAGDAVVFANGTMAKARWSKSSATAMTRWTDVNNAPLSLPAGRTWVELPSVGASLVTR